MNNFLYFVKQYYLLIVVVLIAGICIKLLVSSTTLEIVIVCILSMMMLIYLVKNECAIDVKMLYAYIFFVFIVGSLLLYNHLGGFSANSPLINDRIEQRLSFLGFYAKDNTFTISNGESSKQDAFNISGMQQKTSGLSEISLTPDVKNGETSSWDINAKPIDYWKYPLRINNKCININKNNILKDNSVISFRLPGRNDVARLVYKSDKWHEELKYFDNEKYITTISLRNIFTRFKLKDAMSLGNLLSRAEKQMFTGTWKKDGKVPLLTQEEYAPILKSLIVRINKGDANSNLTLFPPDISETNNVPEIFIDKKSYDMTNSLSSFYTKNIPVLSSNQNMKLIYGIDQNKSFSMTLPSKLVRNPQYPGQKFLYYLFSTPIKYPLPPDIINSFFISNTEKGFAVDGILLPAENLVVPIYARGDFDKENNLIIKDGQTTAQYILNDKVLLGKPNLGLVLSAGRTELPSFLGISPGILAIILFAISSFLFCVAISFRNKTTDTKTLSIIVLLWGLTAIILIFRLIIGYRAALLPPFDAYASELGHFEKSYTLSLWTLLFIPSLLAIITVVKTNFIEKILISISGLKLFLHKIAFIEKILKCFNSIYKGQNPVYYMRVLIIIISIAFIGIVSKINNNEFLFLGQASLILYIAIVLSLFWVMEFMLNSPTKMQWLWFLLIIVEVCIFWGIVDPGALVIYSLSIIPVIFFIILANIKITASRKNPYTSTRWAIVAVIFLFILFVSLPKLIASSNNEKWYGNTAVYYRCWLLGDNVNDLLTSPKYQDMITKEKNFTILSRNRQQMWQMLCYASAGRHCDTKYGSAPLARQGMDYKTTLVDSVYSTFILSEHGVLIGWCLSFVFIVLASILVYSAYKLSCARNINIRARAPILLMIAGYFLFNSLYMASANLNMVVFTGQNIPFLGVRSLGDLFQAGFLLLLSAFLITYKMDKMLINQNQNQSYYKKAWSGIGIFGVIAFLWYLGIGVVLMKLPDNYTQPNNIFASNDDKKVTNTDSVSQGVSDVAIIEKKPAAYDIMKSHVDNGVIELSDECEIVKNTQKLEYDDVALLPIEKLFINVFNKMTLDKKQNSKSCPYSAQRNEVGKWILNIDKNQFKLKSPYENKFWYGQINAGGLSNDPVISLMGGSFSLSIKDKKNDTSGTLDLLNPELASLVDFPRVRIRYGYENVGEFFREANDVYFIKPGIVKGDKVKIDNPPYVPSGLIEKISQQLKEAFIGDENDKQKGIKLNEGALICFTPKSKPDDVITFMYQGLKGHALSRMCWRNGDFTSILSGYEKYLPLIHSLAENANNIRGKQFNGNEKITEESIDLSIDLSLQKEVQECLNQYAMQPGQERYRNESPYEYDAKYISATVMDPFSGEILALPAWPSIDWTDSEVRSEFKNQSHNHQEVANSNWNFKRHIVGSTIKPLLFSTVACGLWPSVKLNDVSVYENKQERSIIGRSIPIYPSIDLTKKTDSRYFDTAVHPNTFLPASCDWPAIFYGFLGTINKDNVKDIKDCFIPVNKSSADMKIGNKNYALNIKEPYFPFTLETPDSIQINSRIRESAYFNMLPQIAGVYLIDKKGDNVNDILTNDCTNFLPSFLSTKDNDKKYVSESVEGSLLPERFLPDPINMDSPRGYVASMSLGGSDFGMFSNIVMAEAGASLITGKKVNATLEIRNDKNKASFNTLPAPLDNRNWRVKNIIQPLHETAISGTAARRIQNNWGRKKQYYTIFKTGTLVASSDSNANDETLLCVVGIPEYKFGQFTGFVPGKTVVFYFNMRASFNPDNHDDMRKFSLANALRPAIEHYLDRKCRSNK